MRDARRAFDGGDVRAAMRMQCNGDIESASERELARLWRKKSKRISRVLVAHRQGFRVLYEIEIV